MSKIFFYLVLAVITMTFFTACEKDEVQVEDSLVGKWLVTSDRHASGSDTIIFTKDFFVLQYFDYLFADMIILGLYSPPSVSYSLSDDEITFTIRHYHQDWSVSETFRYVLNNNSLVIKGFSNPFSLVGIGKDVHFTRIE